MFYGGIRIYVVYLGRNGVKQADSLQAFHLNIVPYLHVC